MKRQFRSLIAVSALAVSLMFSGRAVALQTPKQASERTATKAATTTTKAATTSAPSDKEIADAQAKGLVRVNTDSTVYHKSGRFYGKTKQGKFMSEADAQKAGYRAAHDSAAEQKPSQGKK